MTIEQEAARLLLSNALVILEKVGHLDRENSAQLRAALDTLTDALAASEARATAAEQRVAELELEQDEEYLILEREHEQLKARVAALEAALWFAERNMARRVTTGGESYRMCPICDQARPTGTEIDHAPDCPFALLVQADAAPNETGG